MCGVTGYLGNESDIRDGQEIIKLMTHAIRHRGPDDEGYWRDPESGIALGHRRLSVIDLSITGHQPMLSESERYVIVYNGEIYNFKELRRSLSKLASPPRLRGTSDTEVMLAAFETWGIMESLKRFVGMFAFGLWDQKERILYLARDRMGEKPLYYGWAGDTFLFGSELKALRQHPDWQGRIERDAVALLMRYGYIPAPYSIHQKIYKLPPATLLRISAERPHEAQLSEYWSLRSASEKHITDPFDGSESEAIAELDRLLRAAVTGQMIADVPLGAFLSGGIDSSTIVALMQDLGTRPVKTFSIGFHEAGYDEAPHAKEIAKHLGTDHTELYVTSEQAQSVVPRLPELWDEPFADSSQIPTHLVAALARQHVTVALSGDGGDELFGGYQRYFYMVGRERMLSQIPEWAQRSIARVPGSFYRLPAYVATAISGRRRNIFRRAHSLSSELPFRPLKTYHNVSMSHWRHPEQLVLHSALPTTIFDETDRWTKADGLLNLMTYLDMSFYLPNDILVKVDRAAMGVSLETRVPLLDHRVVEFSQRIPAAMKVRNGSGKWLLRQVLYRYVPKELIERPKMGFGVPIDRWLRTDLRDWAEDLLDRRKLNDDGILNVDLVRATWKQHLDGTHDNHYLLWDILMFQQWFHQIGAQSPVGAHV